MRPNIRLSRHVRLPSGLFLGVAVLIVASWWWLGAPVAMPFTPLSAGEKLYCLSYAPFRGNQSPLDPATQIDPRQIDEDFARLAAVTGCVRTYSTHNGLDRIPEIATRHGLKVILGMWLGGDASLNRRDMETVIALANRFPDVVRAVVVGNEVLLRGEMTGQDLAANIRRVKAAVPMPVTYADVWEFWLRHREVYDAVDFVTIHILPYWEDFPISARQAADHVSSIRHKMVAAFPAKEILLGEVGWPSAGRMREGALPSPANQARVIQEVLALAERENFRANLIEAFDQPWKRQLEGTVGGHWGLFDAANRLVKFRWGEPVSNHPRWIIQAAGGVALAALVFAAAFVAGRRSLADTANRRPWWGVAAMALPAGILIGWAIENLAVDSIGVGGWLRSLAFAAIAVVSPIVAAAALMAHIAVPSFARVLAGRPIAAGRPLACALGVVLVVLTLIAVQVALGLVFDPRYRDFPFAPLTAAVVPFAVLSLVGGRGDGIVGMAEKGCALILALSVLYIVPNETLANWQSLWFCAGLGALVFILLRLRAAPG